MGSLSNREELMKTACEAGDHIIVYGAGMPKIYRILCLYSVYKDVALVPIISSARLEKLFLTIGTDMTNVYLMPLS